jgi:ACS family pantothenate transporter-like MFS transporter
MTWAVLRKSGRKIISSWQWYLFSLLFTLSATSFEKTGVYSEFLFFLKSTGTYTKAQINYYPSIFTTVAIVSTYGLTVMSDRTGNRFIVNPIMFTSVFISCVILLVWDVSVGAKWFAYIIAGFGYAGQASNVSCSGASTH